MKTLPLSRQYRHMSRLAKEDQHLFRKLLKGETKRIRQNIRFLDDLFIIPVSLGSELTCCGFAIEHHQLFRSQLDGKYYLVFFPLIYRRPPFTTRCHYYYYILAKAHHQDDYYCLLRHNELNTYRLGRGYALIKHT